jgi:hypothetical protein
LVQGLGQLAMLHYTSATLYKARHYTGRTRCFKGFWPQKPMKQEHCPKNNSSSFYTVSVAGVAIHNHSPFKPFSLTLALCHQSELTKKLK